MIVICKLLNCYHMEKKFIGSSVLSDAVSESSYNDKSLFIQIDLIILILILT